MGVGEVLATVEEVTRVELPLIPTSKLLAYKTIGKLKEVYPDLNFVKYIYFDETEQALKGVNPPDLTPLVPNAYITVIGEMSKIIKFAEDATTPSH